MGGATEVNDSDIRSGQAAASFVHPALFYGSRDEYVAGVGGFVRAALRMSAPTLVAVPGDRLEDLRRGVGEAFGSVVTADMTGLGRNPGRILSRLCEFAAQHAGRHVQIVGEPIWAGRSPAEITEATRHEALINLAFQGKAATILCPYDLAGLPKEAVEDARRTHPALTENGMTTASDCYTDPVEMSARCDLPLAEAVPVQRFDYCRGQLGEVRDLVQAWAATTGLDSVRISDFVLATGEAAANSILHGGGSGTLRLWSENGAATAEIQDSGRLSDPLAGRARPGPASANGGRGLWLIHQLCDLVETRATATGLTLRLHMTVPPHHG
jgi:anti-sigma regulatory factor (Ser/Thr protein kinase)